MQLIRHFSLIVSVIQKSLGGLILITLMLGGCSFEEPVLPTWTVQLNVPFAEETFRLGDEIVNDSTIVVQGSDSLLMLSLEGALDTMEISADNFAVKGFDTTHVFELGTLKMDSLSVLSTGPLSLRNIFPELQNVVPPGYSIPFTIPDTTLTPPRETIETGDFIGMKIESGNLRIRFFNHLPFPLGPNSSHPNGIQIAVFDSTQQLLLQVDIPQVVNPGQWVEKVNPLPAGSWLWAPLEIEYTIPVAQQTTFILDNQVLDTCGVTIDLALENFQASEAIAILEKQQIEENASFALETDNGLREAAVDRGQIQLQFVNRTDLDSKIVFSLPEFITTQNQMLTDSLLINRNSAIIYQLPLNNMRILQSQSPGDLIDSLHVDYRATTRNSGNIVHIRSTDSVLIHLTVDSIYFKSFAGFLAADTFKIDPFEEDSLVDYNDITPNLRLDDVELSLVFSNEVYIQNMFVDLEICGYHVDAGGTVTDSSRIQILNRQINPGYPGSPGVSYLSLSGQEVADFLNILPTRIRSAGQICASGDVEISQSSRFSGDYKFTVPLRFRIEGDALFDGEVQTLEEEDVDQDIRNAADENFEQASLALQVTNATPLGGSLFLIVSRDSTHSDLYDLTALDPALEFFKEIQLAPAITDPQTGYVTQPQLNNLQLSMTHDEMLLFRDPPLRIGYRLKIADTGGVVALRSSDFVKISGLANIVLRIKDD